MMGELHPRWLAIALVCCAIAVGCRDGGGSDSASSAGALYIALGDSLSAGIGASEPASTGFVALVHEGLGDGVELLNLGHPGDTSQDLLDHGHLDRAVEEIERRNGDDVRLVTLEIGGNDLLRLYFSLVRTGTCPDVAAALGKPECTEALISALNGFEPNLATALDRLRAADADLPVVLMTLYNPFGHLPGVGELGDLSLEGRPGSEFEEGLNDIIRRVAGKRDLIVADLYPLFDGRSEELIAADQIHPNDGGYAVMAEAVVAALDEAP